MESIQWYITSVGIAAADSYRVAELMINSTHSATSAVGDPSNFIV